MKRWLSLMVSAVLLFTCFSSASLAEAMDVSETLAAMETAEPAPEDVQAVEAEAQPDAVDVPSAVMSAEQPVEQGQPDEAAGAPVVEQPTPADEEAASVPAGTDTDPQDSTAEETVSEQAETEQSPVEEPTVQEPEPEMPSTMEEPAPERQGDADSPEDEEADAEEETAHDIEYAVADETFSPYYASVDGGSTLYQDAYRRQEVLQFPETAVVAVLSEPAETGTVEIAAAVDGAVVRGFVASSAVNAMSEQAISAWLAGIVDNRVVYQKWQLQNIVLAPDAEQDTEPVEPAAEDEGESTVAQEAQEEQHDAQTAEPAAGMQDADEDAEEADVEEETPATAHDDPSQAETVDVDAAEDSATDVPDDASVENVQEETKQRTEIDGPYSPKDDGVRLSLTQSSSMNVPTLYSAQAISSNKVRLYWSAVSGARYYRVWFSTDDYSYYTYISTGYGHVTTATTIDIDFGSPGKTVYFAVTSIDASLTYESYLSNTRGVTFPTMGTISNLKAVPKDTNAAKVTWDKIDGVTGYQLFRATSQNGEYTWIKNATTAVVTNYVLTPGQDYWYKVRPYSIDHSGYAGSSNSSDKIYGEFSAPVKVHNLGEIKNLTVYGRDTNAAKLTWDKVSGATGYQVFRKIEGNAYQYQWVKNASICQVTNYSLTPGTVYYYQLRAYVDLPDGSRAYGQFSAGVRVWIQPQISISASGAGTTATISWNAVSGVSGYQVFRVQENTTGIYAWVKNVVSSANQTTISDHQPGKAYWFRARTYIDNADGTRAYGQFSEAVRVYFPQGKPTYRALLVGNSNYQVGNDLPNHANDVAAMRNLLTGALATPYKVFTITDATASGILGAIPSAFSGATENDVSLFYYGGHGLVYYTGSTIYNDRTGSLCGVDGSYVTPAQLRDALMKVPGQVIVLLDCCHSGAYTTPKGDGSTGPADLADFNHAVISAFSGYSFEKAIFDENAEKVGELRTSKFIVLTACQIEEESFNIWYYGSYAYQSFGTFTKTMFMGLGCSWPYASRSSSIPCDSNRDGVASLGECQTYIVAHATQMNTDAGYHNVQTATSYGPRDFPLFTLK